MRFLLAIAGAFGSGILIEDAARGGLLAWLVATVGLGLAAVVAVARPRRPRFVALLLMALAAGGLSSTIWRARVAARPALPDGDRVFEGVVSRPAEDAPGRRRAAVAVEGILDGAWLQPLPLDARVSWEQGPDILPGDRVRFSGIAREPLGYQNEGAFDRARFLGGQGIDALIAARPPGLVRLGRGTPGAWRAAAVVRGRASRVLARAGGDGGALLQALVLGRRGEIRPALDDAFRRAGVSHVLSVSGLHLVAIAFLLHGAVRRLWLRGAWLAARWPADRAAAAVAIPVAIAYTLVTGGEVATVRALVCALIVLLGGALGRRPDALTALAAAALALLVHRPWALFEPSFQLSFAAAAALSTLAVRWSRRLPRGPIGWLGRMFFASLAAFLATAPLSALHFGVIQPAGLIANLLVVPAAELVVLPLGLLAAVVGGPVVDVAALAAARVAELVLFLGAWSPVLEVPPPTSLELAALGAALVALATRPRWALAGVAAVAVSITITLVAPHLRRDVVITFLDVGQGDAAVIEAPGGETWLVDAGGRLFAPPEGAGPAEAALDPGEQAVWPFLRAHRVRRLDLVVLSHPHPDHYGGLPALAAHLPIDELWLSGDDPGDPRWDAILGGMIARGTRVVTAPVGTRRARGGAQLAVIAPARPDEALGVNDNSLVARLDFAGRSVLFAGDLETDGEANVLASAPALLAATVVKVPHHGSRTSSTEAFVRATGATLAVVSCGRKNRFRFPAPEVVLRWLAAGARLLRTDQGGAVTVVFGADGSLRYSRRASP